MDKAIEIEDGAWRKGIEHTGSQHDGE